MRGVDSELATSLVEALPEALIVTRADGTVEAVNRAAEALLGYTVDEVIGESVTLFLPPQARQRADVITWLKRWGDDPEPLQWQFIHLTGRTKQNDDLRLSVRVARVERDDGPLYAITLRDVRKDLEQLAELRHQNLLTARILAISDDAIFTMDGDYRISYLNHSAELLFGYGADELLGEPLSRLLPDRFRDAHTRHIEAFRRGTDPSRLMGQRGEIVGLTKDGREVPLEASITKVTIEGEPHFSAHIRDITERKRAEEALKVSEARFRAMFENALEAIALLDPSGTVLELNESARGLLKGSATAVGAEFWELPWWPEVTKEASAGLRSAFERAVAGETYRVRTSPDGKTELDFSLIPVESDGEVRLVIAEARDITQLLS
jgi:PAS domain S-box-containing protein